MKSITDLIKSQAYKLNEEEGDVLILTTCSTRSNACYGNVYNLATGEVKARDKFFWYTALLWRDVPILTEEEVLRAPSESLLQKELENLRIRRLRVELQPILCSAPEIEEELHSMHPHYNAAIYQFENDL